MKTFLLSMILTGLTAVYVPAPEGNTVARPIRRTLIDVHGVRFWRGLYELEDQRRVVVEWACDPADQDPDGICGSQLDGALPGFADNGRATGGSVSLHLELTTESTLDGARVWTAYPGRSVVLPVEPHFRGGAIPALEGAAMQRSAT